MFNRGVDESDTLVEEEAEAPLPPQVIEYEADDVHYDGTTGWVVARGNVIIRKGDQVLRADYVRVNLKTEEAYAYSNVVLTKGSDRWTAERVAGNFGTGQWDVMRPKGGTAPYRLLAATEAKRMDGNRYSVSHAALTTCTNEMHNCHYHVTANKVDIVPGDYLKVKGAVFYLGVVPFFYLPYWKRDLDDETGWRFRPGYNTRMGPYLLSSYRYKINPVLMGETHFDYRVKRGAAVGQDFIWYKDGHYYGEMDLYYADDQEPIDEDEDAATADIDSDRYRVRLKHYHDFSTNDYLIMQANYLSDTDILEDFFEREYRQSQQPENYAVYTHRSEKFTFSGNTVFRLNDFYRTVSRLPELSFDFMRQQMGDSRFYYQGQTALSFLQRQWAESSDAEEYSSVRFDSSHMFYRPDKYFGFLTVIPRAGYQGTWYSKTVDYEELTEVVTTSSTNVVVSGSSTNSVISTTTATNTVLSAIEKGAQFRSAVELGAEVSFKAFKTWNSNGRPFRHVVEPYSNYRIVPEPNLLKDELYQFDKTDELGKKHRVTLGVRNKYQTKKREMPFDLIDADVYTVVNLDPEDDEEAFDRVYFDAEFRLMEALSVDADAIYSVADGELNNFNSQFELLYGDAWRIDGEYRYRYEESSLVAGGITLFPSKEWTLNIYGRYEMEESRLEEQTFYLQRNFDCMVVRTTVGFIPEYERSDGTLREDEWEFGVQFWLTAFPGLGVM